MGFGEWRRSGRRFTAKNMSTARSLTTIVQWDWQVEVEIKAGLDIKVRRGLDGLHPHCSTR